MADSARFRIRCEGVTIPHAPLDIQVETYNISSDDTGRNQRGRLIQKIIRRGIQKVELTFSGLNSAQIEDLYRWTKTYGGGTGTKTYTNLSFTDPRTKNVITKKGYWGAETTVKYIYDNTKEIWVEGFTLQWIEV